VLSQVSEAQQTTISTYDYRDTFSLLEKSYQKVKLTHKFIVGPPTSKLQAIGVALFKLFRQDVQILYPTPKSYKFREHTKLSSSVHSLKLYKYSDFVQKLVNSRHQIDVTT
jgi:cystathionine beta-lyase family protein involved in aluminum resistance